MVSHFNQDLIKDRKFISGLSLADDHDHDHDHPDTCLTCEATYYNGEITGDPACFDGTLTGEDTDHMPCCFTERLTLERDGEIVYNILRMADDENHHEDHHEDDDEIRQTRYKFRQCETGQSCGEYFDIFDDVLPNHCEDSPITIRGINLKAERTKRRVARLVEEFFEPKATTMDNGMCPSCWAGSYADSYEDYENCALKPTGQEMKECKEGEDTCIVDYYHYVDPDHIHCEVGRDCYPGSKGLSLQFV